jgi:hypothetical protein
LNTESIVSSHEVDILLFPFAVRSIPILLEKLGKLKQDNSALSVLIFFRKEKQISYIGELPVPLGKHDISM